MSIKLVTYNQSHVTALDDAVLIQYICGVGGIIHGCNVSNPNGHSIQIATGHGVLCGRKFSIQNVTIPISLPPISQKGRVKIKMDLSNQEKPIQLLVQMAGSLPKLSQDENINFTNGVYEFELATFDVSQAGITGLKQTFQASLRCQTLVDLDRVKKTLEDAPKVHEGVETVPSSSVGKDGDWYVQI